MIGRVSGTIIYVRPPQILIDVSGVGYEVDLPMNDCADLPALGTDVIIFTHMVVREDAHALYGFLQVDSRDCFRQLIKVSGVGPRIALALLSTLSLSDLGIALEKGDVAMLCRTPGIGKKVAERMLLELKGKLILDNFTLSMKHQSTAYGVADDIANALLSLGYADKEVKRVVQSLGPDITDLTHGIKAALQLLSKH